MRAQRASKPRPSRLAAGVAVLVCLAVAGCGSHLDPQQFASTSAGTGVVGDTSGVVPGTDGGLAPGTDPGQAPGTDGTDTGAPGTVTDDGGGVPGTDAPAGTGDPGGTGGEDGGGGATDDEGAPPGEENDAVGDGDAASCEGFQNGPGITDDTITIANVSDVSGPVPGLFEASQRATQAYVAYFNSTSDICGRKLELITFDSRTDASGDQQGYATACEQAFAAVGSMSAQDGGGAPVTEQCGLPDIRAITTTAARAACAVCYAAQPAGPNAFQNAVPDYIKRHAAGGQKAAMLYLNAGAAAESGKSQQKWGTQRGLRYVYQSAVDTSEFNYVPYVQAMKDAGVESIQFVGAEPFFARLAQTMQQQGFEPDLFLLDPTAYSSRYTGQAGDAAVGTVVFTNFTPFEEASSNAEIALYLSWLSQVDPGAEPTFFGLFAWSATRLFVERAIALGGGLDRESLIAEVREVDGWTANDMHAPMPVGSKDIPECWRFIQWDGARWNPLEGRDYQCRGLTP